MRRMLVIVAGVIGAAAIVLVILFVGRSFIQGPPTCYVNFDGTTYDEAGQLENRLTERGYDANLDGQPGGPGPTPVVTVKDGGLFYGSVDELEEAVQDELGGLAGGEIQTCLQPKLGD